MRPTTATLGIRVTASVTLRELYGAHGAGIRAIAPPFGPHGKETEASRCLVSNFRNEHGGPKHVCYRLWS